MYRVGLTPHPKGLTMTDIKEFYIDTFLPAVLNLTAAGDGGDVTPEKLRYIAHEILLYLWDELPDELPDGLAVTEANSCLTEALKEEGQAELGI